MMHGHIGFGIFFGILHIGVLGGFFYFLYQISKSLKRIANHYENK